MFCSQKNFLRLLPYNKKYKNWIDKWKYILYISVRHKVLKSCRSAQILHGHFGTWYIWCTRSFFMVYKNLLAKVMQSFHCWVDGESQICSLTPSPSNFYSLPPKVNSTQCKNKNVIFSCSHCSCTNFVLISYSFETQVMLILILIVVQYSQNAVLSFAQFLNRQNYSSWGSHRLVKKPRQQCSLRFDKVRETPKILGEKEQ